MKRIYFLLPLLVSGTMLFAQTWSGTVNNDWNNAGNWIPAGVPAPTGNVLIPGSIAGTSWPAFTGPVTINSLEMQPGSELDVQGYPLTINGAFMNNTFSGAVIRNSSPATVIRIHLNTGTGGFLSYFNGNTVYGDIEFNLTGLNPFHEGTTPTANVYHGNVVFNIQDGLPVYFAYGSPSQVDGNLALHRTVSGATSLFYAGVRVEGNFTYRHDVSCPVWIGNPAITSRIGGTVHLTATNTTAAAFEMHRLLNETTGGSILVTHPLGFTLQLDTLLVNTLTISGYQGNNYAKFLQNDITGQVSLADDASYGGGFFTYIRNNIIRGNCSFSVSGTNSFLEADAAGTGNTYLGDLNVNSTGAPLYIGYGAPLQCSGNLSVKSAGGGQTIAFNAGAGIGGNFSFSNPSAGPTYLGNALYKTSVGGNIGISVVYTTPGVFEMQQFVNATPGGSILVQHPMGFTLRQDTLLVNSLQITGYQSGTNGTLERNRITGQVWIEDDPGYSGGFYTVIRGNHIEGNSRFILNGTNMLLEGDQAGSGNTYTGNVGFTANGSGGMLIAYLEPLHCSGDLSIERTAAGGTHAFNAGSTILGNLRFNNSAGGGTTLGNTAQATRIGGKLEVRAVYPQPEVFNLYRLINQTGGGKLVVQQSLGFEVKNDTLLLDSVRITGYRGNNYAKLENNTLTADVHIEDDAAYSGGFYTCLRSNLINGNSRIIIRGINTLLEADLAGSGNTYNGDVSFTGAGSADLIIAYAAPLTCSGNLAILRTAAGNTLAFKAGGSIGGHLSYTNHHAGNVQLGETGRLTTIGGRIDISAATTPPGFFSLYGLSNQAGGGRIAVQQAAGFDIRNNTLFLDSLRITGFGGGSNNALISNTITGEVLLADDPGFTGGFYTYLRSNTINGNSHFLNHGSNALLDADIGGSGSRYRGNLTYTRTNGTLLAGINDFNEVSGNLTVHSDANTGLGKFSFTGDQPALIEQLGTQPLEMAECRVDKTGTGNITLNDPLRISGNVQFLNGLVNTLQDRELIFLDNASWSGASAASFVNGPCIKTGDDAFTFPVGKQQTLALLSIGAPVVNTDAFSAEYFAANPHTAGYDTAQKAAGLHHISALEYWMLNRTAGASSVAVTLSWNAGRSGEVNNLPDLRVARWNGSTWTDEGNGGTTGNPAEGTLLTAAPVSAFSPFTLASSGLSNPLPVRFIRFTASVMNGGKVLLQWTTTQDVRNARFEAESSTDGRNWKALAVIPATASGEYRYVDHSATGPVCYYRIKQVDTDNRYQYSVIRIVRLNGMHHTRVWPNPASDYLYVQTPVAAGSWVITDLNGRIIKSDVLRSTLTQVPVWQLAAGSYFIRIIHAGESSTIPFIRE